MKALFLVSSLFLTDDDVIAWRSFSLVILEEGVRVKAALPVTSGREVVVLTPAGDEVERLILGEIPDFATGRTGAEERVA